jgi:hypothetical protein
LRLPLSLLTFIDDEEVDDAIDEIGRVCFSHHVSATELNLKMSSDVFDMFASSPVHELVLGGVECEMIFLELLLEAKKYTKERKEKRLEGVVRGVRQI